MISHIFSRQWACKNRTCFFLPFVVQHSSFPLCKFFLMFYYRLLFQDIFALSSSFSRIVLKFYYQIGFLSLIFFKFDFLEYIGQFHHLQLISVRLCFCGLSLLFVLCSAISSMILSLFYQLCASMFLIQLSNSFSCFAKHVYWLQINWGTAFCFSVLQKTSLWV